MSGMSLGTAQDLLDRVEALEYDMRLLKQAINVLMESVMEGE